MRPYIILVVIIATLWAKHGSSPYFQASAQSDQDFYKIPDPFGVDTDRANSYFSIKSFQCTVSSHKKKIQTEVEEYFSLAFGLTYSIHRNPDDRTQEYAIIGDGPRGKAYIIRNPSVDKDGKLDCELDHLHHHKQVFPWQYVYDLKQPDGGPEKSQSNDNNQTTTQLEKKKKKKRRDRTNKKYRKSSRRFIYGVGAVWMNAIKRGLVSNKVGDDSSYSGTNLWSMREEDLEIELLFNKPEVDWPNMERTDRERSIASSTLESTHLLRRKVLEKEDDDDDDDELDGMNLVDEATDNILVREFKANISVEDPVLKHFFNQLAECRRQTKKHRVFPSLMRAVSLAPERLYALGYIQRKYPVLLVDGTQTGGGKFDEKHHRFVRDIEYHTEWFSFKHEAQLDIYEPANNTKNIEENLVDIFLKRFSDRETERSSRHSTVHYHMQERDGHIERCKKNEADPLPSWFNLMIRRIHLRRENQKTLSGLITGLGALIMNAADVHYKQFELFKRTIDVPYDPSNLQVRHKVTVDAWQLYQKETGRTVHFYFTERKDGSAHEIEDLVRVDIRDSRAKNPSDVIEDATDGSGGDSDFDMLARYEILSLETDKSTGEAEFMFTLPEECTNPPTGEPEADSSDDDDDEKEENLHQDDGFLSSDDDDDDDDDDKNGENSHPGEEQNEGEDFEFEPGKFAENFQFPDIFDIFDGRLIYKMVYTIGIVADEEDKETKGMSKQIHLMDFVDTTANLARHLIFYSKQALEEMKPDLEFFVDYSSELIFRQQAADSNAWSLVDDLDPWFRLLSAKLEYRNAKSVQSSRVRSYGLGALWRSACLSENSYFLGVRKGTVVLEDQCEYRDVSWGLEDDGDNNLLIEFKFLWNVTQFNLDLSSGQNERPNELLSLDSVFFTPNSDDESSGNSFVSIEIPKPIVIIPLDGYSFSLPEACLKLAEKQEAIELSESTEETYLDTRLPSLWEFMRTTNTYSAVYYVTHVPKETSTTVTRVAEYVDRNKNLGKLVIGSGPETREVFIDDNKKNIYTFMAATGVCRRIVSLSGLIDLVTGLEPRGIDFNTGKMFGLAALWMHLWQSGNITLSSVENYQSQKNDFIERRTYRLEDNLDGSGFSSAKHPISYKLVAVFKSLPRLSKADPRVYSPEYFDFRPTYSNAFSGRTPIHRTTIHIGQINNNLLSSSDLQLPNECAAISSGGTSTSDESGQPQPHLGSEFPRLSDIIKGTPFYMRSEITSTSPLTGNDRKLYIMDEWLRGNNGDIRLKTYGLQKDFDLLIYGATKESFDVSTPFNCLRVLPKLYQSSTRSSSSLLDFWSGETTYVDSLSQLYFGPVSLWHQAELNIARVELVSSMELVPIDVSGTDTLENMKREMLTEVWRFTSPNKTNTWSYKMHFERVINDEIGRQWYVLEKIDILANTVDHIEIDVINYRYGHTDQQILDKFNLPEGYNCCRNSAVIDEQLKDYDDLNDVWNSYYQMWYEASLELTDVSASEDPEFGSLGTTDNVVLPTATGHIIKASKYDEKGPQIDVFVHYKKSHDVSGHSSSTKTVYDRTSSLIYVSDERLGFCSIGQDQGKTSEITIEFLGGDNAIEYITLDNRLINLLFRDTKSYMPINRYTANGYAYSVYERSIESLDIRSSFKGPAAIIRKFKHRLDLRMSHHTFIENQIRLHSSVTVKILVFDSTKSRITAVLNLSLFGVSNIGLTELVRHTNVARCYNDGDEVSDRQVRTFVFEYKASDLAIKTTTTRTIATTNHFIQNLLKLSRILPTQLSGSPRLDFAPNQRLRFTVQLIESPTAIEYATKRMVGTRMSLELESKSEVKLVSSLNDCSRWCDQVSCVVLTYCSDHTCRIVTPNMMHNGHGNGSETVSGDNDETLTTVDLSKLFAGVHDTDCSNFVWISKRPSRLDKFSSSMEILINQEREQKQLDSLSLMLFGSHFETCLPVRFYEIKDDLDLFGEDSTLAGNSHVSPVEAPVYKTIGHNQRINQGKFYELIDEHKVRKLTLIVRHGHAFAQCLELCRVDQDCIMVSHCKQPASCHLVSGRPGNLKALLDEALEQVADVASGCTVNVRDFLPQYSQFRDTSEPTAFQLKLDNYSALECAALCSHYDGSVEESDQFKCLSFDSCTSSMQQTSSVQSSGDLAVKQTSCYLQTKHIMLDSLDRSILAPSWHNDNQTSQDNDKIRGKESALCEHYSKSVLADFRRMANRKLATTERQAVRGSSPDQCAINCQLDEQCQAFEYCFDDKRQPIQSCYFIRSTNGSGYELDLESFKKQLIPSHTCSIYILDHQLERYEMDAKFHIKLMETAARIVAKGSGFLRLSTIALFYIAISIFLGSIVQLVYIKFFGQPIVLHRRL